MRVADVVLRVVRSKAYKAVNIAVLALAATEAQGQSVQAGAATRHVFPQVASGSFDDGSSYQSSLWVLAGNAAANCAIGGPFQFNSFLVAANTFVLDQTVNQGPISITGQVLQCSTPVTVTLTYQRIANGVVTSMATVFSSLPMYNTRTPVARDVCAMGIALFNPDGLPSPIMVRWDGADGRVVEGVFQLYGHESRFVEQYINLTGQTQNGILSFVSIMGLRPFYQTNVCYVGDVFTTVLPQPPDATVVVPSDVDAGPIS